MTVFWSFFGPKTGYTDFHDFKKIGVIMAEHQKTNQFPELLAGFVMYL